MARYYLIPLNGTSKVKLMNKETNADFINLLEVPDGVAEMLHRGEAALGKDSPSTNRIENCTYFENNLYSVF